MGQHYKDVLKYQNHEWTRICHDRWDILDAEVTCKQLGYPGAYTSMDASEFGLGASINRLTDVECTGSEIHVTSCRNSGWSSTNCPSYKVLPLNAGAQVGRFVFVYIKRKQNKQFL